MTDSWSSDDEDRITGLRSAEKIRRRRGKKTVAPHSVVRYKVPGQITVPGRIIYFNTSEMLDNLSAVYTTHGADKLLFYIQQQFERSRRDTAAVTHSREEDREVIRMVLSYYYAYLLTLDKTCKIKINYLLKNIHNLNVNYADAVISQIQIFLFSYAMNNNNYSKAHKHLQASLLVLQNVAPGTCTANVYFNLASMYEQLAYLMPHRKTSHLHSALHLCSVAREHYRCEGEMTGDWEEVNAGITRTTLRMINIKLNMPNVHGLILSLYGRLYDSSLVEDSGRRCTVTDTELSAAEYIWDHIIKPIAIDPLDINDLACVIYLYLRKSQIKKQGREYTLALEDCVTAMNWYNDLFDDLRPAITAQIGSVLRELFQEIQEKRKATTAGAGEDLLNQVEKEVVHSAECYIDERILCYTRTEEVKEDTAAVYTDRSDSSFDLSSEVDENSSQPKKGEHRKPLFTKTSSSSVNTVAFVTEESRSTDSIADSDQPSVTDPPYLNKGISTEDEVLDSEIDIDLSIVAQIFQYMGYDIDSSDEDSDCTDSNNDATGCEGEEIYISDEDQKLFLRDDISEGNVQLQEITEDTNPDKTFYIADCKSQVNVMKADENVLKGAGVACSELTQQMAACSNTCTGILFASDFENSEQTSHSHGAQSATGNESEGRSSQASENGSRSKVSTVTREGKHDTVSSSCESEYYSAQENSTSDGQITDSDASGQEGNAYEDGCPVKKVDSHIQEVKYDPSVDDVTESSGLDELSPNDDSQDTEVMDGY